MTHTTKLAWQDGQPFSETFGDVYFSRDSGLEETRHVFLKNNQLPQRFSAMQPGQLLTIGETGFGTGLNFLCAWQCFRQSAPPLARLHFVSVEKYPLSPADLIQALALWPELSEFTSQLCAQYSALPQGWHRFSFDQGRVSLTLIIGDALTEIPRLDASVDAWFLDGFSPSKNPDMWSDTLFHAMAAHSAPGASFATFTCAGFVRRGLKAAGFQVEKTAGFGSKREMSRGSLLTPAQEAAWQAPWYARPGQKQAGRSAVVIGGGIAGAASAYSLALRGWSVTLIERQADLAREGSGNAQGILYARLSAHHTHMTQLVLSGYVYTLGLLKRLLPQGNDSWHQCGVLQLPVNPDEVAKQQALLESGLAGSLIKAMDQQAASQQAGLSLPQGGLFFPDAGWVRPAALVKALCAHPNIQVKTSTAVLELDYNPEQQRWLALSQSGPVAMGDVVVLAGAADSASFDCTSHLPLKHIRGQISYVPATDASRNLKTVICHEGYVAPAFDGRHSLGASFTFNVDHLDLLEQEHRENLEMLRRGMPALHQAMSADRLNPLQMEGRAAFRCTSPDYLPLVGPVVSPQDFIRCYSALGRDASSQPVDDTPWIPGLYVNTAHGSRGLISAPLSGEILAACICGEPAPLPKDLMDAIHPSRFLQRDLIRGKLV